MSEGQVEADVGTPDVASAEETSIGLEENVAGALSYISIVGLVFYFTEKENAFVRFHAAQSIVYSVALIAVFVLLSVIGTAIQIVTFSGASGTFLIGSLLSLLVGLVWLAVLLGGFVAWVYLLIRAYQGKTARLPVVGGIADRLA